MATKLSHLIAPPLVLLLGACTITTTTPAAAPPVRTRVVVREAPPPPPPRTVIVERPTPPPPVDEWVKLGERSVESRVDRDTITVGRAEGRFNRLRIKVEYSAIVLYDLVVVFSDGTRFHPDVDFRFRAGETQSFDLPGRNRSIKRVEFRYRDLPGGGRANVELWGR